MANFALHCYFTILLTVFHKENPVFSLDITGKVARKIMNLLIYRKYDSPCVHGIKVYDNAIFTNKNFTEISIPHFPGIDGSYCTNYCIKTGLCNAIFVAKSGESQYNYDNNVYDYFDWCKVYKVNTGEVNVTDLTSTISVPVVDTWNEGTVPEESELILLDIDPCCPNTCPNGTICANSEDGSFLCISGFATLQWTGPEAEVYLPFDSISPGVIVGNFKLADGLDQQSLWLDGETSIEVNIPGNSGCWRQVSTCQTQGFSLAFWIKVLSGLGFESHGNTVDVISALREEEMEGWNVRILRWNSNIILKFLVHDLQNPSKQAKKEIEQNFEFKQWNHYLAVYQYTFNNNDPNVLFQFYKNGKSVNGGYAHYDPTSLSSDVVNKLVFGRKYISSAVGPFCNKMLDEGLFYKGSVDACIASTLYQHYRP